jgi:hypothetical protein
MDFIDGTAGKSSPARLRASEWQGGRRLEIEEWRFGMRIAERRGESGKTLSSTE